MLNVCFLLISKFSISNKIKSCTIIERVEHKQQFMIYLPSKLIVLSKVDPQILDNLTVIKFYKFKQYLFYFGDGGGGGGIMFKF